MNTQTITITGVDYVVKFGIKSNMLLGKMWGVNRLSEIGAHLAKLNFKEGEEPTMDQLIIMSQLILSGVKSQQPNAVIDEDEVFDFITNNAEVSTQLMELYAGSLPQDKVDKSKNVNPDQRKKK
mgnify:CR=1 FL=1